MKVFHSTKKELPRSLLKCIINTSPKRDHSVNCTYRNEKYSIFTYLGEIK